MTLLWPRLVLTLWISSLAVIVISSIIIIIAIVCENFVTQESGWCSTSLQEDILFQVVPNWNKISWVDQQYELTGHG